MKTNKIRFYEVSTQCLLQTKFGEWRLKVYKHKITNEEHILLAHPSFDNAKPLVVRIHSSCITGDIFCAKNCDCREQLDLAMKEANREKGAICYLFHEGRGIGLTNKIKSYAFKEIGYDTYEANRALGLPDDNRDYGVVGEMMEDLDVKKVILLTNNPEKAEAVRSKGIEVELRKRETEPNKYNKKYLKAQKENGHLLKRV